MADVSTLRSDGRACIPSFTDTGCDCARCGKQWPEGGCGLMLSDLGIGRVATQGCWHPGREVGVT